MPNGLPTTFFAVAVAFVMGLATSMSAADRSGEPTSLAGCLAPAERTSEQSAARFVLSNAVATSSIGRRMAGSNSAKASTPIGGAPVTLNGASTVRASTAKASTPLGGAQATRAVATAAISTSKASAPIRRSASAAIIYELDADPNQLLPYSGHTVEITGTIVYASPASTARAPRLKVDQVRMMASSCSSR